MRWTAIVSLLLVVCVGVACAGAPSPQSAVPPGSGAAATASASSAVASPVSAQQDGTSRDLATLVPADATVVLELPDLEVVLGQGSLFDKALRALVMPRLAALVADQLGVSGRLVEANLDGIVDGQDFTILKSNFGKAPSVWGDGNFNEDTIVDGQDFTILKAHFGEGTPPGNVPEPATMSLLALGGLVDARQDEQQRGFADPVGADQPDLAVVGHAEGDAAE